MFTIEKHEAEEFFFAIGEKKFSVPKLDYLPYTVIAGLADAKNAEDGIAVMNWFISEVFEKYAPGCTDGLTFGDIQTLLTAYDAACSTGE